MQTAHSTRPIVRRLLLSAAATLATLLLAEVVVRALGLAPKLVPIPIGDLKVITDRELIWVNNPGSDDIDELGFRGREVERPKRRQRILVLGDSVAFGTGLDEAASIPRRLEHALAERGIEGEVLNGGVPGYDSTQEARALELLDPEVDPDLVLVVYCLNDAFTTPGFPEFLKRSALRAGKHADVAELLSLARGSAFEHWLTDTSHLARLIRGWRSSAGVDRRESRETIRDLGFAKAVRDLARVESAFLRIGAWRSTAGVPVYVAIAPLFRLKGDSYSEPDVHASVAKLAERAGLVVIDPLPAVLDYVKRTGHDLAQDSDAVHPTAEGAEVVATALAEQLAPELRSR
jgi:lysophospholipase L1-like esterase